MEFGRGREVFFTLCLVLLTSHYHTSITAAAKGFFVQIVLSLAISLCLRNDVVTIFPGCMCPWSNLQSYFSGMNEIAASV